MLGKPASPFFYARRLRDFIMDDSKVTELQKYTSFSRKSAYEPHELQKCS